MELYIYKKKKKMQRTIAVNKDRVELTCYKYSQFHF